MPVRITDLSLIEEFETYLTQVLIEASVDNVVLERLRYRLLTLQLDFTRLITEETPDESHQVLTINNFVTAPARNAK